MDLQGTEQADRNRRRRSALVVALLILLGAAYLRMVDLSVPSLWYDEILHVEKTQEALQEPWQAWFTGLSIDRENGPLYYATQLLALRFAQSETGARLAPALAGIAAVALLMVVTLAATRDRRVALVAGALLAVSPLHVYYSREARLYAAVMLMATWLLGLLVARRRRWMVPTAYLACLATAYLGAVAAPVLLSFTLLASLAWIPRRRSAPPWSRHYLVAGLLGLGLGVWLFSSVEQISAASAPSEMIITEPLSRVALDRLLGSLTVSGVEWASASPLSFLWLALAGLGFAALARIDRWRTLAIAGMCVLPIATWMTLLVVLHRWYNVRYTSAGLPALVALTALGIVGGIDGLCRRLPAAWSHRPFSWISPVAIIGLTSVLIVPNWAVARSEPLEKPDWRGLADLVGSLATETEPLITHSWWAETCLGFYLERTGHEMEVLSSNRVFAEAQRLAGGDRPAWLAASGFLRADDFRGWMRTTDPIARSSLANIEISYHPGFSRFLTDPKRIGALPRVLERRGEPTDRQDFGSSELLLGSGWSYSEVAGDGTTFRWARSPKAEIGLLDKHATEARLAVKMLPFPSPDLPAQTVEIGIDGRTLETVELAPGWNRYEIAIPPGVWGRGPHLVSFRFGWQQSPADLDPQASDTRNLAVAFDSVELIR